MIARTVPVMSGGGRWAYEPGSQRGCEADDDVVVGEVSVQGQDLDHPVSAAAGPNDSVSR
jgi:hypothetical protein